MMKAKKLRTAYNRLSKLLKLCLHFLFSFWSPPCTEVEQNFVLCISGFALYGSKWGVILKLSAPCSVLRCLPHARKGFWFLLSSYKKMFQEESQPVHNLTNLLKIYCNSNVIGRCGQWLWFPDESASTGTLVLQVPQYHTVWQYCVTFSYCRYHSSKYCAPWCCW